MAKTWSEQKAARKEARRAKQDAWLAHNTKHRPVPADQLVKLPKPKESNE